MKRAVALAGFLAALAVPAATAGTPGGHGLLSGWHQSHCTGAVDYDGYVTLVPGAGNSFWVAGNHLVIQSVDVTYDDDVFPPATYTFGKKTGQAGDAVTCTGHFDATDDYPGYTVTSHDLIVP